VTLPTKPSPSPASAEFFGAEDSYGNGELWVGGLWPGGVVTARDEYMEPDGAISIKFGWWRVTPGQLRITGRRLDGAAPPLRAHVPAGYADAGFQATGVIFPGPGCWEVTGTVGTTPLTFVTYVIR
jgi:hypothetical protein